MRMRSGPAVHVWREVNPYVYAFSGAETIKATMTKRRKRRNNKNPGPDSEQSGRVRKSNRKVSQALAKVPSEKSQLMLEAVVTTQHCHVEATPTQTLLCVTHGFLRPSLLVPRWKEPEEVRLQMSTHDLSFKHSSNFLKKHPSVLPRMRSILLDWMMEVCEAYTLHRQTFYLAQDYFDRFMMTQSDVGKGTLQLVGITCLFIAAKMEETRSPKLSQMVYVTADTYTKRDVIQMELIILKHLRWQLSPETPLSWVDFFLQMVTRGPDPDLFQRQFSVDLYLQITRLLDLCTLSVNAMDYRYEVLAASVLSYFIPQEVIELVTDLPKPLLQPCVSWMAPFAQASFRFGKETLKDFGGKTMLDKHTIQTHSQNLHLMDQAGEMMVLCQFPTPPSSTEKMSVI